MKNILFVNSKYDISGLFPFLDEVSMKGVNITFLTHKNDCIKILKERSKKMRKFFFLNDPSFFKSIFFVISLPLIFTYWFIFLFYNKLKTNTDTIICLNWFEKITATPIAKILKIKTIWLELPENKIKDYSIIIKFLFKLFSKKTSIVVFDSITENNIKKLTAKSSIIKLIHPGIINENFKRQENIFSDIAKHEHINHGKKHFTVGTAANLEKMQNIETLFHAIKKCSTVISNVQLVVIGDGKERKNLQWLTKKMDIKNLVWFVGEQEFLRKWFDDFDVFVSICDELSIKDINITLEAMSAQLPIIGQSQIGLEDILEHDKSGILIENENSDNLSDNIIKLYKHKLSSFKLGEKAKTKTEEKFRLDLMVDNFLNF